MGEDTAVQSRQKSRSQSYTAPIRYLAAALIAVCILVTVAKASAESTGPGFPCTPTPLDALARLTCSDQSLVRAHVRMIQTYYALRQVVGPDGQKPLKSQFLSFIVNTRQACGLPPVEPNRNQSQVPLPESSASCVTGSYDRQRVAWASKLSGPASEEATRAPEMNVAGQGKLQALGYIPKDTTADGVFGTGTRTGLLTWQHATGRPETGFFSDADAKVLLGSADAALPTDPLAELRQKPLAAADYDGKALTIGHANLQVTMNTETSNAAELCHGGFLDFSSDLHRDSCRAVVVRVAVDGKTALTATATLLEDDTDINRLYLKVAIRRLDPKTTLPQVVITDYSGGAHCCTSTAVATEGPDGKWQVVSAGQMDGDMGFNFLDLDHDGSSVLVDDADGFLYQFASHAGSFSPTRLQRLTGTNLQDVTKDSRYRGFLMRELKGMEQADVRTMYERNGYFAGWVAQKALVGQLMDGWRTMLAAYDHRATEGRSLCAVDERVWTKNSYGSVACPDSQEHLVSFPEALALHLVKLGYVSQEESTAFGFDPAKVEAERKAATARWEEQLRTAWFVITHAGTCTLATRPASPADLITADRANGTEDDVNVLEVDSETKPLVVRVGKPQGNGLQSTITFYRGSAKCTELQQKQQKELERLK